MNDLSIISFFCKTLTIIHKTVNYSRNFMNYEESDIHIQAIELLWSQIKSFIIKSNLNDGKYIEGYLSEFIFRKKM